MVDPILAYLDPTTGSIAYQVAISSALAAAAACRLYWHKLRRLFGLAPRREAKPSARRP